jgi:hypothetical protein
MRARTSAFFPVVVPAGVRRRALGRRVRPTARSSGRPPSLRTPGRPHQVDRARRPRRGRCPGSASARARGHRAQCEPAALATGIESVASARVPAGPKGGRGDGAPPDTISELLHRHDRAQAHPRLEVPASRRRRISSPISRPAESEGKERDRSSRTFARPGALRASRGNRASDPSARRRDRPDGTA